VASVDHDAGLEPERECDDPGNVRRLGIDVARMSFEAALPVRLAVIGTRSTSVFLRIVALDEPAEQLIEDAIDVQDRVVVDVGARRCRSAPTPGRMCIRVHHEVHVRNQRFWPLTRRNSIASSTRSKSLPPNEMVGFWRRTFVPIGRRPGRV
jgi:hypothetical protein